MENLFERILKIVETFEGNSQTAFAKKIGCQQSTFNGYMNEDGQRKIRLTLLQDILRVYPQINRDWLCFGEGEMTEEPLSRVAGSPMTTAAVPPIQAAIYAAGGPTNEVDELRQKLMAAHERNAQLTDEVLRLNEERRQLMERLDWEKIPDKPALLPPVARGGLLDKE